MRLIGVKRENFGMTKNSAIAKSRKSRTISGKIQLKVVLVEPELILQVVSRSRTTPESFVITVIRRATSLEIALSPEEIMCQKTSSSLSDLHVGDC